MKISSYKILVSCLLLILIGIGCSEEPKPQNEEFMKRRRDFPKKINPNYFPYILGTTIGLVVIGTIFFAIRTNKREKQKRIDLASEITKARKSGEIMDADYEELKKYLEPMNYKPLLATFDFALANKRRFDFLHSKYPKEIAKDLFDQKHWVGMTLEQLIDSKGHATRTEEEILTNKTIRTYIYETIEGVETFNVVEGIVESSDKK